MPPKSTNRQQSNQVIAAGLTELGQQSVVDAVNRARMIGVGDLLFGGDLILAGSTFPNNYQKLAACLELYGTKFFADSYPQDEPRKVRSFHDYPVKGEITRTKVGDLTVTGEILPICVQTLSTVLSEDELSVFCAALDGNRSAIRDVLRACPQFLLLEEFAVAFVTILEEFHAAPRKTKGTISGTEDGRFWLKELLPERPGGGVPVVQDDVRDAFLAYFTHFVDLGHEQPVRAAKERVEENSPLTENQVRNALKGLVVPGRPKRNP